MYPVPRVNKAMFIKEFDRIVLIGVLEEAHDSEWGAPSSVHPNPKTYHLILLSDFRNLNR